MSEETADDSREVYRKDLEIRETAKSKLHESAWLMTIMGRIKVLTQSSLC